MAEKLEMKKDTIAAALRNSAQRFARTSNTLVEGLAYSRLSLCHNAEAEGHFSRSLALLREVEANMGDAFGLDAAKLMLNRRNERLGSDIEALQQMRTRIADCEDRTKLVLEYIGEYAREKVGSVFGKALGARGRESSASSGGNVVEIDAVGEIIADTQLEIKPIVLREHAGGSIETEFDADLEPLHAAVELLETSAGYAARGEESLARASDGMAKMIERYDTVDKSIEGAMPVLKEAKQDILMFVGRMRGEVELIAALGMGVSETVTGVLQILDQSVRTVLGISINPKTMGEFIMHELREPEQPHSEGLGSGPGASGHVEDGHDVHMDDTPGPENVGRNLALAHCRGEIGKGNSSAALAYFATYGGVHMDDVFADLDFLAKSGLNEASEAVEALATIAKSKEYESVAHKAAEKLLALSQSPDASLEVNEAAFAALMTLNAADEGSRE